MKNKEEKKTRQSGYRRKLENNVLAAYNVRRKQHQESPIEAYTAVGNQFHLYYYQVQYIILKAKKAGKKVL